MLLVPPQCEVGSASDLSSVYGNATPYCGMQYRFGPGFLIFGCVLCRAVVCVGDDRLVPCQMVGCRRVIHVVVLLPPDSLGSTGLILRSPTQAQSVTQQMLVERTAVLQTWGELTAR